MDRTMKQISANLLLLVLLLVGTHFTKCSDNTPTATEATSGEFTLLTYNVAGLPQQISPGNPEKNIPLISPLLNGYGVALIQEDFYYHEELQSLTKHRYKSTPKATKEQFAAGDGLNRFSKFSFSLFKRAQWSRCSNENGNDCLAKKGFSAAETEIAAGVKIDIYNLHMDAGGTQQDLDARTAQIEQLIREIKTRSADKPVIVAGDINLNIERRPADQPLLQKLLDEANLTDACFATGCTTQLVDRILYRGSNNIRLKVVEWKTDPTFVDENGDRLSDHFAVGVRIGWETL